jgi:hypothetical protein
VPDLPQSKLVRKRPRVRLTIDTLEILLSSIRMSTKEVGQAWLDLLHDRESPFLSAVLKRREYDDRVCPAGWAKTRDRIFDRDGHSCTYCGSTGSLECDHIVPVSRGGQHEDDNLTTACRPCNASKGAKLLSEWLVG